MAQEALAESRELEQREQDREHLPCLRARRDEIAPGDRLTSREKRSCGIDRAGHVERTRNDRVNARAACDAEYAVHGGKQFQQGDREARRRWRRDGQHCARVREAAATEFRPDFEHVDDFSHLLILEQATHQLRTRIIPRFVAAVLRQQHLRLDAQKPRGHLQVLGRFIQPQRLDAPQELFRDPRDGDVIDVDLLLTEQRKEQIEWPAEVRELDDEAGGVVCTARIDGNAPAERIVPRAP